MSTASANPNSSSSRVLVANCPASPWTAVYKPWTVHTSRITVQCFDRNALLSTPKFSLSVPTQSNDGAISTSIHQDTLVDLLFSSPHRLIGCVESSSSSGGRQQDHRYSLVVWDISRGVPMTPRIILPEPYQLLHIAVDASPIAAAAAHHGDTTVVQDKLFVLAYHTTTFKLVVFVYHLGIEQSWKLIQKIKVGSTLLEGDHVTSSSSVIPYRSCVLAVCTSYQALVVHIPNFPKKIKIIHIETGHVMGKCKLPSLDDSSTEGRQLLNNAGPSVASDALVFSKDGTILALYASNTTMGGNIILWDLSSIYKKTSLNEIDESDYEEEEEEDDDEEDSPEKHKKKNKKKKKNRHHPQGTCIGILSAAHGASSATSSLYPVSMEVEQVVSTSSSSSVKDSLVLTLFTHGNEKKTRLYSLSKHKDSSSNTMNNHVTSWTCDIKDTKSIVSASFGQSLGQVVLVQGPTDEEAQNKDSRSSSSSISFSLVSFLNSTQVQKAVDSSLSIQPGDVILTSSIPKDKKNEILKKRKANEMAGQVVIGPGESGSEAFKVSDVMTAMDKKQKAVNEEDDFFKISAEDEGEMGDDGRTIEQRLASLTAQLHEEDEESEEDAGVLDQALATTVSPSGKQEHSSTSRFNVKSATSGSLETLLRQALASNDDSQLEIALQVADKKVIENSILGLAVNVVDSSDMGDLLDADKRVQKSSELVLSLLSKLVTRLARKPTRAEALAYWIRTILFVLISSRNDKDGGGIRMGEMERQVALRLGPLRNLLSERVECLPALLKLEGRLELLTQHRSI